MNVGCDRLFRQVLWTLLLGFVSLAASAKPSGEFVIDEGDEWVVFDYRRDIEFGSALDFSKIAECHAPAGKYGWVKAAGEHFEFENLPGVPQRFYGVNLCMSLNYPSHEEAESMIRRFRRMGYNSIRIHHHDKGTVSGSKDGLSLNAKNMDRLDYLLATAIKAGMYITTDLYVSRLVPWRSIGIDREGNVNNQGFKALTALHEPAYRNWQAHVRNFLMHVNPYTGRRLIDEPACFMLCTVNENWMSVGWKHIKDVRECEKPYDEWKASMLAKHGSGFMKDSLKETFSKLDPWRRNAATSLFFADMERRAYVRNRDWLRSIGVRALITSGNHGPNNVPNQSVRDECFEVVDIHSYEDHPTYLNKKNRHALPTKCVNGDWLVSSVFDGMSMGRIACCRAYGKPFVSTEWNCCGPSEYRCLGGLWGGALFARQDWAGVWRFAYSHSIKDFHDIPQDPGAFNVSSDPIMAAQERQIVPLFIRRDVDVAPRRVNLTIDADSLMPEPDLKQDKPYADVRVDPAGKAGALFSVRLSSGMKSVPGAENMRLFDCMRGGRTLPHNGNEGVRVDFERKVFAIAFKRICAVYGEPGTHEKSGDIEVAIKRSRSAVSVVSIDGAELQKSRRLLVAHLTDAKGRGALLERVADGLIRKEHGDGTVVLRTGEADVGIRLGRGRRWKVYALLSSGGRRFEVPHRFNGGMLEFTASVRGADGLAVMEYEICVEEDAVKKEKSR